MSPRPWVERYEPCSPPLPVVPPELRRPPTGRAWQAWCPEQAWDLPVPAQKRAALAAWHVERVRWAATVPWLHSGGRRGRDDCPQRVGLTVGEFTSAFGVPPPAALAGLLPTSNAVRRAS